MAFSNTPRFLKWVLDSTYILNFAKYFHNYKIVICCYHIYSLCRLKIAYNN